MPKMPKSSKLFIVGMIAMIMGLFYSGMNSNVVTTIITIVVCTLIGIKFCLVLEREQKEEEEEKLDTSIHSCYNKYIKNKENNTKRG